MDKVAAMVDMEVANQEISNKTRMLIISKMILLVAKDNLEAERAKEVKASKDSKVVCHYCGRIGHMQASCYRR